MDEMVDDILNMFNSNKPLKITMSCPDRRRVKNEPSMFNQRKQKKTLGTNYAKEYKEKDDEEYLQLTKDIVFNKRDCIDNMSDITSKDSNAGGWTNVYGTYNFAYRPKTDLPIHAIKDKIISMITNNSVVIIRGSTGCGKTTQVPQLILDAEFENKRNCNIIVTQPRRIAALSIAKRVSQERDWPVGTIVGYQIGLIKSMCEDTRITYCTTGVLLHKLVNKKHMMDYTHIILDEVHERDEDMDFLLLVVRKLLRTNSMMVKVILMSATIDVDKFSEYFSTPMENKLLPASVIDIPEGSPYNISIYYLDEMEVVGYVPVISADEPSFTCAMIEFCIRIIHIFDHIDKKSNDKDGRQNIFAVLIFLPGIQEIEELRCALSLDKYSDMKWDIIILHSLISTEDQEKIFKKPFKGYRRIILSTNIAESSVTVPDVKYVIDFCLTKVLVTNPGSNYQSLQLCWASKSNCQQRAGRAGRIMDGRVYRMVPRSFYETVLDKDAVPEMLRTPLANVILKTKMLDMGEPKALLALALDPPDLSNVRDTILLLKEIGAILNTTGHSEFDGDMTPLGRVMASLPLDVHLTKLIVLGHVFDVLQDAIIIAASMSVKNMFNIGVCKRNSTYYEKLEWAANSASDSITYLNAFKVWRNDKMNRRITSAFGEREWARQNGLRVKSLREINALVSDITSKLRKFGIKDYVSGNKRPWKDYRINPVIILKIIIAGAFYPNYFIKMPCDIANRRKAIEKSLPQRDPRKTVFLHGWPLKQPGPLYAKRFQEIFAQYMQLQDPDDITVSFDGSSRVYIEYDKDDQSADDYTFVRSAIKMRQSRVPIEVDLLSENEASSQADELELMDVFERTTSAKASDPGWTIKLYNEKPYPELPDPDDCKTKVTLYGPSSPLEAQLTHMTDSGMLKKVVLEGMSVNSVLLDTCPENPKELFLVAESIHIKQRNVEHLVLRNTTLLPDTPGFASLIILIFTPYMELRRDPLGTHYTGALCGLGYDYTTGLSLFPEHDLQNIFDVEITMDDLRTINKLRHWMNVAMHFVEGVDEEQQSELTINCQNQIKNAISDVIYKSRQTQVPILSTNFHKWNLYDETLFLEPARGTTRRNCVYSLHKALDLNKNNPELEEIIRNLLEMDALAHEDPREATIGPVVCKLCNAEIQGIISLRIHLCSELHKIHVKQVDTTTEFGEDLQSLLRNMRL
ncbi:probable ATP-dependent RNA helicase spindle-E [Harpegnathos saltator]|uniref:Putative ATP-dependent RNA helicase TDRD9 n=1 Tax=Harpegnathos saltator TaxID=610380 RepID=E2C7T9_HARSA|nr:probable ATP-dependent RNA helicase spindle-E [Harpegnathos saltator]EFN75974.1 Putative ATP-dependent RNA helicase TDRD9 [Harpegnathos saltator]